MSGLWKQFKELESWINKRTKLISLFTLKNSCHYCHYKRKTFYICAINKGTGLWNESYSFVG